MVVGVIIQKDRHFVCGVVEWPDGVFYDEVLKNWLGLHGIDLAAADNFTINLCPVTPWATLDKVWKPISG